MIIINIYICQLIILTSWANRLVMGRLNPKLDSFLLVELDELDVLMTIDPRVWMVTPSAQLGTSETPMAVSHQGLTLLRGA